MAKSNLMRFYDHKPPTELQPMKEMEPFTKEPKPEICEFCGCGNYLLRLAKLHTIQTQVLESYIIRICKDCDRQQPPIK